MTAAELAKQQILDLFSVDELQRAWIDRTQDPLFGEVGILAAKKPMSWYTPSQVIRIGYEYLTGIESDL